MSAPPDVAPVRTVIVDDEPVARAGLRAMLADTAWIACIGEAANGPAAVTLINQQRPDLVFLDIQMPGILGTEVIRQIQHSPFVIFTTAYGQHAVAAFELGAVDYLLKPFGPERLLAALDRVRGAIGVPGATPALERMAEFLTRGPISRLFVRAGNALIPVAVDAVSYYEASGDYVIAHVGQTPRWIHLSLNRLEERLDPGQFVRIHRTHIVNMNLVKAFRRHGKGRMIAELLDGTQLPVSRNRAQHLRTLGL